MGGIWIDNVPVSCLDESFGALPGKVLEIPDDWNSKDATLKPPELFGAQAVSSIALTTTGRLFKAQGTSARTVCKDRARCQNPYPANILH